MDFDQAIETLQSDLDFYANKSLADKTANKKALFAKVEKKLSIIEAIGEYVWNQNDLYFDLQRANSKLSDSLKYHRQYLDKAIRILSIIGFSELTFDQVTGHDLDLIERLKPDLKEFTFKSFMTVLMSLHRIQTVAKALDQNEIPTQKIIELEEFADQKAIPEILKLIKLLKDDNK